MFDEINQNNNEEQNPKKRVLFIITQSEFGGAQHFLSQLVSQLDKNKFILIVASGAYDSGSDGNKIKSALPADIKYIAIKSLCRNPNLWSDIRSLFELRKIYKRERPDVVFLNSSKAGFNGSLAARLITSGRRPKIIYRIGGWTFNDPWPRWKKLFYRLLERISAHWKDWIIVNNTFDLSLAKKYKIKPKKEVILIHNGIDPYLDFLPKEKARLGLFEKIGQASIIQADYIVGTIANFYPAKDLLTLIRAAAQSQNKTVFVIIGDGQIRGQIEKEISTLGLEKKVFLVGKIPEAHKYLPAFDIFILSSVKEGFPWAVLEAMAAKLPVVATNVGALPEMIEDGKSGLLVEPKNPQQIAKAIKYLIENERVRQELGIQAHQTVLRKFPIEKMIRETEELFD